MRSNLGLYEIRDLKDLTRSVREGEVRVVDPTVVKRKRKKKEAESSGGRNADRLEKKPAIPPHLLQVPVTERDKDLNRDSSAIGIGKDRVATLSLAEIERAPASRRDELLRRYRGYLSLVTGSAVGSTQAQLPEKFSAERGDAKLSIEGKTITASRGDDEVVIDLERARSEWPENAADTVLRALDVLLVKNGGKRASLDKEIAGIYLALLGPTGALTDRSGAPAPFKKPHLIAYDLNGTVDGRSGIGTVTDWLGKMGASSVITTSIGARSGESCMTSMKAPFDAFFGGDAVRPGFGNKVYEGVAATFGISPARAKDQLIVVGDSSTDEPGDLKGVIFLNDGNRTPAEALFFLFRALDEKGNGSFADGLDALTGGKSGDVSVAPLRFSVSYNARGPVIRNLQIRLTTDDLVRALNEQPPAGDPEKIALHALAMSALASASNETIDALINTSARKHAPFVRRVANVALDSLAVPRAKSRLELAEIALSYPVAESTVLETFTSAAKEATSRSLPELVSLTDELASKNDQAKTRALASAARFARSVELLAEFGAAGGTIPSEIGSGSLLIDKESSSKKIDLDAVAQNGLPADIRDQEALIRELRSVLQKGAKSEKETLAAIAEKAKDVGALEKKIEGLFERRAALFDTIRGLVSETAEQIEQARVRAEQARREAELAKQREAELAKRREAELAKQREALTAREEAPAVQREAPPTLQRVEAPMTQREPVPTTQPEPERIEIPVQVLSSEPEPEPAPERKKSFWRWLFFGD